MGPNASFLYIRCVPIACAKHWARSACSACNDCDFRNSAVTSSSAALAAFSSACWRYMHAKPSLTLHCSHLAHLRFQFHIWCICLLAVVVLMSSMIGLKYLEENAKKEGVITTESGMQYKV